MPSLKVLALYYPYQRYADKLHKIENLRGTTMYGLVLIMASINEDS